MNRDSLLFLAKLAEEAERYTDMIDHMKTLTMSFDDELSMEESNLLLVAYKNEIGPRRAGWRVIRSIEAHSNDSKRATAITGYRQKIENEIRVICNDVSDTIDKYLIKRASTEENKAFYLKMKADYFRYLAEICTGQEEKTVADEALTLYQDATSIMQSTLDPTHPLRLGLALNFSVFYYDIHNSPEDAIKVAKTAFDDAIAELDSLSEESYRDTTLILQLLRDNISLWMTEDVDKP